MIAFMGVHSEQEGAEHFKPTDPLFTIQIKLTLGGLGVDIWVGVVAQYSVAECGNSEYLALALFIVTHRFFFFSTSAVVTDSWRSSGEQSEHNVFIWQHGLPHNSAFCSLWCFGLPATYLCLLLSLRFLVSLLMFPAFLMPDFRLALGVWYASLSPKPKRHFLALDRALTSAFIQLSFSSWPPLFWHICRCMFQVVRPILLNEFCPVSHKCQFGFWDELFKF